MPAPPPPATPPAPSSAQPPQWTPQRPGQDSARLSVPGDGAPSSSRVFTLGKEISRGRGSPWAGAELHAAPATAAPRRPAPAVGTGLCSRCVPA